MTGEIVLLSNSTAPGRRFLEHAFDLLAEVLAKGSRVLFLAYGPGDADRYAGVMAEALAPLGSDVVASNRPADELTRADALFVGGGNAFLLLRSLDELGLLPLIRKRVAEGMPYLGASAGANVACPTIRTTNDMPIVEVRSLAALGLVPFQVNPHYVEDGTRDRRIGEFLAVNDVPVVGLPEGTWLRVRGDTAVVGGVAAARIFERGAPPRRAAPGADVSGLLRAVPRYDARR